MAANMIPVLKQASKISPEQSVVCIITENRLPEFLKLSEEKVAFVKAALERGEDSVAVNCYTRQVFIVRIKKDVPAYKSLEEIRKMAAELKSQIMSFSYPELVVASASGIPGSELAFAEGLILSGYSFRKYLTKKSAKKNAQLPGKILLYGKVAKEDIDWTTSLCSSVYFTRDLINEPPNSLNATALSKEIRKLGTASGFKVDILTKGMIETLKMGGLLAVNRGSVDPPVFCILEWKPAKHVNSKPVVLVGKGVMYDTGGLNIKTGDYMAQMKGDMSGAAAVAGAMSTIASMKLPVHVVGLIPATDNRPGGNAYTQGDVLTMYNKSTVEVANTDAEGRLILADALSYAGKYNPELIINIATLTGSAALAFGNIATAVMGNAPEETFNLLEDCGNEVYERLARMPFWEEYRELLKSDIADIKNVGGREAGAITAGKFLESFTEYPLIHLDIAGTGLLKNDDSYRTKEGPGVGVRLLATFIKRYSESKKKKK